MTKKLCALYLSSLLTCPPTLGIETLTMAKNDGCALGNSGLLKLEIDLSTGQTHLPTCGYHVLVACTLVDCCKLDLCVHLVYWPVDRQTRRWQAKVDDPPLSFSKR